MRLPFEVYRPKLQLVAQDCEKIKKIFEKDDAGKVQFFVFFFVFTRDPFLLATFHIWIAVDCEGLRLVAKSYRTFCWIQDCKRRLSGLVPEVSV